MDLHDRLRRYATNPAPAVREELIYESVGIPIDEVVAGTYQTTPLGDVFYSEKAYALDHYHGLKPLREWLSLPCDGLACLAKDRELADLQLQGILFFDTETTGLGGAGTVIFLAGVGFVQEEQFIVRQYFLTDFDREPAFLWALNELMAGFEILATFNGRAFDWPLWQQRLLMSRMRPKMADPLHIDLLPMARRLWKERLPSCSLPSLEPMVLGIERENDVPGEMVPELYFRYLVAQDAREVERVFYHNHLDILSMVTLMTTLAHVGSDPSVHLSHGADHYSLGKVYEELGDDVQALTCYERALEYPLSAATRERTLQRLSFLHKRLRQRDEAVRIWLAMVEEQKAHSLFPYVELAKYYEHQERDYERARRLVVLALQSLQGRRWIASQREAGELQHRLGRLDDKIAKRQAKVQRPEPKVEAQA